MMKLIPSIFGTERPATFQSAAGINGSSVGNACVIKPAEDACLSLLRLAELAAEIGLPDGAINLVPGFGENEVWSNTATASRVARCSAATAANQFCRPNE